MIKSNRISTICQMVSKRVIAEVGADHGYITLNLFDNNKLDFAYLTDISSKSLQKAKDNFVNFKNYNVEFLVGDGLNVFNFLPKNSSYIKPEQIIIAGMGGNEIIKILQNDKNSFDNFVLQPQRNVVDLRKYLQDNFFEIEKDVMTKDGRIFYNILKVKKVKTKQLLKQEEILFGKTNIERKSDIFKEYLLFELEKLIKITKKTQEVNEKILQIKEVLKEIN